MTAGMTTVFESSSTKRSHREGLKAEAVGHGMRTDFQQASSSYPQVLEMGQHR